MMAMVINMESGFFDGECPLSGGLLNAFAYRSDVSSKAADRAATHTEYHRENGGYDENDGAFD